MMNEIYRAYTKQAKESDFGEPTVFSLTKEVNGFAAWLHSPEDGIELIFWEIHSRDRAIERAVEFVKETKALKAEPK
jgi:hypothetical protein